MTRQSRIKQILPKTMTDPNNIVESIAFFVFAILSLWLMIVHEPWGDEAQAWLIAKDYSNPISMMKQAGYEGSPMFWHIILWILSHLGLGMWSMQLFHTTLAILTGYMIVYYAPFPTYQKVLSIFGYYFVFEYNTIARSYGLTIFLLAYLGIIYKERFDRQLTFGLTLVLIAQTNIHGLIFALVIFGTAVLEKLIEDRNIGYMVKSYYKIYLPFIISILLAIVVLLPPGDLPTGLADWSSIRDHDPIGFSQFFTMRGFFPMQTTEEYFWTYGLRVAIFSFSEAKMIANLILLAIFYQFFKKGYPLILVLLTIVGYNILFVYKRGICPRHCGLIYIVYFFVYWYSQHYPEISFRDLTDGLEMEGTSTPEKESKEIESGNELFNSRLARIVTFMNNTTLKRQIFTIFLIIQVLSMPIPVYHDTTSSFSHAEDVANYLEENNYLSDEILIAGHAWFPVLAIIPHLPEERQQIYYLEQERYGTYITWNERFFNSQALIPEEVINRSLRAVQMGNYSDMILILDYEMQNTDFYQVFNVLKYFDNALIGDENFYVYRLSQSAF